MATEIERLDALLSEQEATIQAAFREFIRDVHSEAVLKEIADKLDAGDVNGAMAIVDSYAVRFANVLPVVQTVVGVAEAAALSRLVGQFAVAITFDPSHSRAAQLARANRMQFIRQFTDEQRAATRQAIASAFETGEGTAATARAFRNSIGLTSGKWIDGKYRPGMQDWVTSYEQSLRNLDRDALSRALRDRRFDGSTARAIELKRPLTEDQIRMRVDRYRARALAMRSENIARTEALTATSQARREAAEQMVEQTGQRRQDVERTWHRTHDGRTRDWHDSMEGQTVSMDEPYTDGDGERLMYPGDPSASGRTRINCRCTETYGFKIPA